MSMFLTRFHFNPARRGARKLLGSPHATHAAVRAAFASAAAYERAGARTLWRLDNPAPGNIILYIVSPGQPDLTHLVEQAGWPTLPEASWETRSYDGLLASLEPKQRWAFRLTANPVHSGRKTEESKDTQRFGYLREREQAQWLTDRAARYGFCVIAQADGTPNLALHHRQTVTFKRGNGNVTLVTTTFDGVLEIVDADMFRRSLINGIGHAKAYGCGMLTLAPLPER
jgi:CRISPR system Cascade subunit CasE